MQESKQRKIYNKTVNALLNSDDQYITRPSRHDRHSHNKKLHFCNKRRHDEPKKKVKKSKKWRSFNHATLKNTQSSSTYIGTERLTKQVGFLTKGKISDSISRLEKIIPSNLKARANQDLHRILKSASHSQHYVPSNCCDDVSPVNYSSNYSNLCDAVNNSPVKSFASVTPPCQRETFVTRINKMAQTTSSLLQESRSLPDDDLLISARTVTETLYPVIARANKQIFNEISNLGILKKELLSIKMRYDVNMKTPSSSSNNESSQDVLRHPDDNFELNPVLTQEEDRPEIYKERFELNPVLTHDRRTPKQLKHLFPDVRVNSLGSIDEMENESDNDCSPLSITEDFEYNLLDQKSVSSSDSENKPMSLVPRTPSTNGSPVWVPVVSPVKFAPKYAPTPKLYYRQKMF